MHRVALSTTVGLLLLAISGCGGDAGTTTGSTSTASPAADATGGTDADGTADAEAEVVDYSANSKKVCNRVDKLLEGKAMERFATELGQLIIYKQVGQTAKATEAREDAKRELKSLAAAVRKDTKKALDPELKAAGQESADGIEATAADNGFFKKLRTIKDVDKNLESEMTPWLTPLATYCA